MEDFRTWNDADDTGTPASSRAHTSGNGNSSTEKKKSSSNGRRVAQPIALKLALRVKWGVGGQKEQKVADWPMDESTVDY